MVKVLWFLALSNVLGEKTITKHLCEHWMLSAKKEDSWLGWLAEHCKTQLLHIQGRNIPETAVVCNKCHTKWAKTNFDPRHPLTSNSLPTCSSPFLQDLIQTTSYTRKKVTLRACKISQSARISIFLTYHPFYRWYRLLLFPSRGKGQVQVKW